MPLSLGWYAFFVPLRDRRTPGLVKPNRQTDGRTERQTDRQTDRLMLYCLAYCCGLVPRINYVTVFI